MKAKLSYDKGEEKKKSPDKVVNKKTLKEDRKASGARLYYESDEAQRGNFLGGPAPRTGGKARKSAAIATGTSNKKDIKASIARVRQGAASKAAKKAAIKSLKR